MKKFPLLGIISAFILITALLGCSEKQEQPAPKDFAIVFTNDVHGCYAATGDNFGHDYLAAVVNEYKASCGAAFVLDAGDATQGSFFVNNNQGEAAIEIMNAAGYDAMTLGNHEFDFGIENTHKLQAEAKFPFLSQIDGFTSYTIIERGGVKLGVFGITTANTVRSSNGGRGVDFGTIESQISYAKDCVAALKAEGADFIVCLSHLGVTDTGEGTSCDIRDNADGIDLIVDGHSHTKLADIAQNPEKAPIVSTGEYANAIGVFESVGGVTRYNIYPRSYFRGLAPVSSVTAAIDNRQKESDEAGGAVIARSNVAAEYDRTETRTKETALGDLVADAVRAAAGADVAFVNGGNIRANLEAGDVTVKDAYTILPYINNMMTAKVKGAVIKEALELSVSRLPGAAGGFLQVSGLTFEFDAAGVTGVTIGGAPLDENADYTLATSDWLAGGGDDYAMLVEPFTKTVPGKEAAISTVTDAFVWYLGQLPGDFAPKVEGRIIQKEGVADEMKIPYTLDLSPEYGADSLNRSGDHPDSPYYYRVDFHNAVNTDTLTILPHYKTFQQTSEFSCGIAAMMTVLEYYGKLDDWNERTLGAFKTPSAGVPQMTDEESATSLRQLIEMFEGVGGFELYSAYDMENPREEFSLSFIREKLNSGTPILIGWNDWGGHWEVVIGYDTMGTDIENDDVLIVADPYDTTDHNQDGYGVIPAERFIYNFTFYNFFGGDEVNDCAFLAVTPKENQ